MEETFKNIKKIRAHIKDMFLKLTAKKDIVNGYYIQYVEKNKKNKLFGLDSFHFQSKLIELEYKHLHDEYLFMDNRIYCDYYKLYGMVSSFCKQNFKSEYKFVNYPVYKDLEPYRVYDFETINNIHYNIIDLIQFIQNSIKNANDEIIRDKNRLKTGLNIENYIHNLEYNNNILISNIKLYENYLKSYHIYHMDFLKKLSDKISLFWRQLSNNMQVNDETLTQEFKDTDTELKTVDELFKNEITKNDEIINIDTDNFRELKNILNDLKVEIIENEDEIIIENKEEPRQRYIEDKREIEEPKKQNNKKEESCILREQINEPRDNSKSKVDFSLNEPILLEEYIYEKKIDNPIQYVNNKDENNVKDLEKETVHITSSFINNCDIEPRDIAIERNAFIPEISVENILDKDFVGIKEPVETIENILDNEKKKRRRKKK